MSMNPKRILLIRLSSLGDIVLTTPAIRAVREHFPKAYIAMLVGKQSIDVVAENPHLNDVIPYDRTAKDKNTGEMLRVLAELRQQQFDMSIDFQRKFRTSLLAYLCHIPCRVGYHQWSGMLCTIRVPDTVKGHAIDRNLNLLRTTGIHTDDRTMELFISEEDEKYASRVLKDAEVTSKQPILGMFPGAGWILRQWMPERFAAVGDLAAQHFGARVLIFGSPQEQDLVVEVASYMTSNPITLTGLKIRQLAALIGECDVFVTNDTGPMHISVAMKTPTVALFGPGNHKKFQPLGFAHTTIRHPMPCSPCKQFTDKCTDNICMKTISVEEVWKVVQEKLRVCVSS